MNAKLNISPRGPCKCGHVRGHHPLMKEGKCAAPGCHCVAFDEAAPDPLAEAERAKGAIVSFELATGGEDRGIDALAIVVAVLEPLTEDERAALIAYVSSRYQGQQPCAR